MGSSLHGVTFWFDFGWFGFLGVCFSGFGVDGGGLCVDWFLFFWVDCSFLLVVLCLITLWLGGYGGLWVCWWGLICVGS